MALWIFTEVSTFASDTVSFPWVSGCLEVPSAQILSSGRHAFRLISRKVIKWLSGVSFDPFSRYKPRLKPQAVLLSYCPEASPSVLLSL